MVYCAADLLFAVDLDVHTESSLMLAELILELVEKGNGEENCQE